jgi:hypothetical protein
MHVQGSELAALLRPDSKESSMEIISHRRAYVPSVSLKQACCAEISSTVEVFFYAKVSCQEQ